MTVAEGKSVNWRSGNAEEDSRETRGWLLGHFIDPTEGVRSSKDVILVSGNFRIDLTEGSITLDRKGDYILWGPGIDHSWEALAESIVLTVRWPSSIS